MILAVGTTLSVPSSAQARTTNGCRYSGSRVSYKVTPPNGRITGAARTNYYKAISSAQGYWNNRVKPQFFLSSFTGPVTSITFDYELYGNNNLYGWVDRTSNCSFWGGPLSIVRRHLVFPIKNLFFCQFMRWDTLSDSVTRMFKKLLCIHTSTRHTR